MTDFQQAIYNVTTPLRGSIPQPIVYRLSVKQKFDGLTIIEFYCQAIPRFDKDHWIDKVKNGNMTVNGKTVTVDYCVKTGEITQHSTPPVTEPHASNEVKLIYEDDDFIVLDKPAPLPMHPCGRFARNSLGEFLKLAFPTTEYKIIHRIDGSTTGIVVLGKSKETTQFIAEQFEKKTVQKTYLALVEGVIKETTFSSTLTISKDKTKSGGRKISTDGNVASTNFEVLERREKHTLLKVTPLSGRTNQIRLHLAGSGHPIVGDLGYKNPTYFDTHPLIYPEDCLCLHAWKLSFIHPTTKKEVSFETKVPEKFKV